MWSRDGREIFYSDATAGGFYSVRVTEDEGLLKPGEPAKVFCDSTYTRNFPMRPHDVAPDGRFLMIKEQSDEAVLAMIEGMYPAHIKVVQGWFSELKEKWTANQ